LFLGERFYLYHGVGIAMIAGGIALASFEAVSTARAQGNLKKGAEAGA
jgi:drug/metabolite transporter (DMT)-like permease